MTSLQTGQTETVGTLRQSRHWLPWLHVATPPQRRWTSTIAGNRANAAPPAAVVVEDIHDCWQPGPWRCPTTAVLAEIQG